MNDIFSNHHCQITKKKFRRSQNDSKSKRFFDHLHKQKQYRKRNKRVDNDRFYFHKKSKFDDCEQTINIFEFFHRIHSVFRQADKIRFDDKYRERSFKKYHDRHFYRQSICNHRH